VRRAYRRRSRRGHRPAPTIRDRHRQRRHSLGRERLLPLIVATALFVENMDSTALATALPAIATDLHIAPIGLQMALTAYLLALAMFIPVSGWVADRFGARPVFMAAIALFLLGSLGCAASGSLGALVAARFVQGIGGAMMVPVGRLVLLRSVPKDRLVHALSWLTIPALLGPMLGPPIGGLITTYGHWRGIFLINLPIGLLGIWLAWKHVPLLRSPVEALDWRGFAWLAPGLALAMFGFAGLGRHLVGTPLALTCLIAGVGGLALYAAHWRRHEHPLLDLALLRLPTFRIALTGGSLFRIGAGAMPFLLPLMLQLGFGLTPLQSGLLTFTGAIGAMGMKPLAAWVLHRHGFRRVLMVNGLLASAVLCGYGLFRADSPTALIVGVLLASGCLRSLQFTSLNALVYAEGGPDRLGLASSVASLVQQLPTAMGVTVGSYALGVASAATGLPEMSTVNFALAFVAVGLVSASAWFAFRQLAPEAGAEMSGRAETGMEVKEPMAVQRPGT
jgi:EmrB/QacA subfamily drug resistance transporter